MIPNDEGDIEKFLSCPMLFIPATVREWFNWFQYNEDHPHVKPPYWDLSERYKGFEIYYKSHVADFSEMVKLGGG